MRGKIIKGIAGFYYVRTEEGIIECKAKGLFRNESIKPLVGDNVQIEPDQESEGKGLIVEIEERKNQLIRPASANVDQAMLVFAIKDPKPNLVLLDRFLVFMEYLQIPSVICFAKYDIATEQDKKELADMYQKTGYPCLWISSKTGENIDQVKAILEKKTTVLAGPSGAGKSTLVNLLQPDIQMETGEISKKIQRGKHTTRHVQLITIDSETYIMDTPGFTSLELPEMEKENLAEHFPEFVKFKNECRFQSCAHINEPDCAVKEAVSKGWISTSRYSAYKMLYSELHDKKKFK